MTSVVVLAAPAASKSWLETQPRLYRLTDHAALDHMLGELWSRYPNFEDRLRALALLRVGTPYKLGCLGEEKGRDTGPLFRIDEADCTVLVLTTDALAHAHNWQEARAMMRQLNYYPVAAGQDPVRYDNRVHFTEDRITHTRWFHDITSALAPVASLQSSTLTLNRKQDGSKLLAVPFEKRLTLRWIPCDRLNAAMLDHLPKAAGVAFIRKKSFKLGVMISHEAMVIDRRTLVEADSIDKHVIATDLLGYVRKNSDWFDGVVFFTIDNQPHA
jgi:hypothetical protein